MRRWIYVSRPVLDRGSEVPTIRRVVEVAIARNSTLGVTGALVFTGARFAQLLEGPTSGIMELQQSIHSDQRHTAVTTVSDGEVRDRICADWSLAYSGPANYLARIVDAVELGEQIADPTAAANLLQLFREFSYKSSLN
jgi:hypothetical protein